MATIVKTGGGVPVSDYEALQAQLSSLQNSYDSLNSEYSSYKSSHAYNINDMADHLIGTRYFTDNNFGSYSYKVINDGIYSVSIMSACVFNDENKTFSNSLTVKVDGNSVTTVSNAQTMNDNRRSVTLKSAMFYAKKDQVITVSYWNSGIYWNGSLFMMKGYY